MSRVKDLIGNIYGRLTVVSYAGLDRNSKATWNCICECGNVKVVSRSHLCTKIRPIRSCGCLLKEQQAIFLSKNRRGSSNGNWKGGASRTRILAALKECIPCTDCNKFYPSVCMGWDHLPQYTKLFQLGGAIPKGITSQQILEEINKCELVCHNCHALRTSNRR